MSSGENNCKLRIKHPSGAEFEAEGPADFILKEKAIFFADFASTLNLKDHTATRQKLTAEAEFWGNVVNRKNDIIKLKFKPPELTPTQAVLIIIAANRALDHKDEVSAMTLATALRASGYAQDRLDRLLTKELKDGRLTASGSKRNRSYQITPKGLEKAYLAIQTSTPPQNTLT